MSRWAEAFAAFVDEGHDTIDTSDKRSGAPSPAEPCVATVKTVETIARHSPVGATAAENLEFTLPGEPSVPCVTSVNEENERGSEGPPETHPADLTTVATQADKRSDRAIDPQWWRDEYEERAAMREFGGHYARAEAEALAWGELQNRWHLHYGERVDPGTCAGCRRPIGSGAAIDLIDMNRVHDQPDNQCLMRHGRRWRSAATRALVVMGLTAPDQDRIHEHPPHQV